MKMFGDCQTIEDLKREYRRQAMDSHPDQGGNFEKFVAVNEAYEERFEEIKAGATDKQAGKMNLDDGYREVIAKIINLPDIEIELVGSWVWVSGNTYSVKEQLKEAGFYWASKKKKWYWRPEEAKVNYKSRKTQSMEEIRSKYGSEKIQTNSFKSIAGKA